MDTIPIEAIISNTANRFPIWQIAHHFSRVSETVVCPQFCARQFQQIGGPSVTVWRELRRIWEMGVTGELKELREAADKGEWNRFMMLMGGPEAKRKDFPISLAKQWNDKPNRDREPKGDEVIGIAWEKAVFPTRIHQWTVRHKCEPDKLKKPVAHTELSNEGGELILLHRVGTEPWSTVNNCTQAKSGFPCYCYVDQHLLSTGN